jgi:hypothetical protein
MKSGPLDKRIQRFVGKRVRNKAKGWDFSDAPDTRQQKKVRHPMSAILWALEFGLMSNQVTLRDVEALIQRLGRWLKALIPSCISDTTLDTMSRRLDPGYLHSKLVLRIRDFHRSKMLTPVGLPCGIATVDGKNLSTLDHSANGAGHPRSSENSKWHKTAAEEKKHGRKYWLMLALRAVLTSAEAKPCIFQFALPSGTGESTGFPTIVNGLHEAYGRSGMIGIIDGDAGLTSLKNANHVTRLGYGYIFGLKGNQPELYAEAQALLIPKTEDETPEIESPWELRNGDWIRRQLWRTDEMQGFENSVGKWEHLQQTWLIRQETMDDNGKVEIEDRYFVTSLSWSFLKPAQILLAVRGHWGVENDAFNSLDLQWREDSAPWCTMGTAVIALGILRILAYNTAQVLRRRKLRLKNKDGSFKAPMRWRSLFKDIESALKLNEEFAPVGA